MKTPILGSTYVTRSINAADARMVNLFPEVIPEGGKEPAFLQRCPGLTLLSTVGDGPVRGLWAFSPNDGVGFVVSGTQLYKINNTYTPTLIGTVAGTGPVSMADNGTQLFIAANGPSYIYNNTTNAFGQITDPDFPGAVTVCYLDGYFVFNEPNSQKMWVTTLLDGTSIDPLEFASTEGSPDGLLAVVSNFREVWAFGTNSIEVWYDSGATDFPLQRIQGAFNELGCAAPYSIAKMDNGLFWLGRDRRGQGIVYRANGYQGQRISTHAVESQIQQYSDMSDAIAYTYQQDGHSFYVLIFPTANTTWVYDAATQAWHERAGFVDGAFTRHRSNCQMAFNNKIVVGDYENGNIYAFDLDVYADNGQIQKWLRTWRALPTGQNNLKRTAHHSLQLDCETGVGLNLYPAYASENIDTESGLNLVAQYVQTYLATQSGDTLTTEAGDGFEPIGQYELSDTDITGYEIVTNSYPAAPGYEPEAMLRWSDDGGHTWSNEHWSPLGRIGAYGHRTFWRRLGMTLKLRDRVYELSMTDPVKVAIMGAELLLSPTNA
ncbi:MAG: packaged DNA stabilization protein [Candidatus Melainabacteria bacterium]|nr:packaged DNA stabilization protein [Candidatus Melainabacteria bacterium]